MFILVIVKLQGGLRNLFNQVFNPKGQFQFLLLLDSYNLIMIGFKMVKLFILINYIGLSLVSFQTNKEVDEKNRTSPIGVVNGASLFSLVSGLSVSI